MARDLKVVPKGDGDEPEKEKPQSRLSITLGIFKFEAVGKFLEQKGAVLGLAVIIGSITAVLILLGDKLWRLFK